MRNPDFLPIEFVIVGGAMSGVAAAIALARVGHKVTLLDESPSFDETPMGAGCRLPPNATKVLYRWGMEERLRACSVRSTGILFASYDSGSVVASHEWEEEVIEETGGDFLLLHYSDLRRILAESAREHGAILRTNAHAVDVHPDAQRPYVTLATGEVLTADVVIGADGCHVPNVLCRRRILKALEQEDTERFMGMQLFNVIVPEAAFDKVDDQEMLRQLSSDGKLFTWFGPTYGALGFPIRDPLSGAKLFTLFTYVQREDSDITVVTADQDQLLKYLNGCDPRLVTLAKEAVKVICIPLVERPFLEEWVHPQGRLLAIGEAAHPIYAGSLYALGLSLGDAAVLGRLFSHLHTKAQIARFLSAVQEVRAERVQRVVRASAGNIYAVSLPPGLAEVRDRTLRERAERGIEDLGRRVGEAETSEEMVQAIEGIFAYEPEDGADNWWIQWGLTEERAARIFDASGMPVEMQTQAHDESR